MDNLSNLELPQPQFRPEQAKTQPDKLSSNTISPEIGFPNPELGGTSVPTMPPMPTNQVTSQTMKTQFDNTQAKAPLGHDLPMIADDNDLIEKEWVDKAKKIVEQTKHDPYKQNREMSKYKAGYMKKRYNRDIKISEE